MELTPFQTNDSAPSEVLIQLNYLTTAFCYHFHPHLWRNQKW